MQKALRQNTAFFTGRRSPIGGKAGAWPDHIRARVLLKQQLSPHPAADRGLGAAGALLQ
ncbi:hypothetical protein [Ideonella dechloratans]|uniref:hypothetical protein n=1 Tax=Ideonella dechloratans TaxID=36863 RepID=UPI0035AE1B84